MLSKTDPGSIILQADFSFNHNHKQLEKHFFKAASCMRATNIVTSFDVGVNLLFYVHGKHLRSCRDGQLT